LTPPIRRWSSGLPRLTASVTRSYEISSERRWASDESRASVGARRWSFGDPVPPMIRRIPLDFQNRIEDPLAYPLNYKTGS